MRSARLGQGDPRVTSEKAVSQHSSDELKDLRFRHSLLALRERHAARFSLLPLCAPDYCHVLDGGSRRRGHLRQTGERPPVPTRFGAIAHRRAANVRRPAYGLPDPTGECPPVPTRIGTIGHRRAATVRRPVHERPDPTGECPSMPTRHPLKENRSGGKRPHRRGDLPPLTTKATTGRSSRIDRPFPAPRRRAFTSASRGSRRSSAASWRRPWRIHPGRREFAACRRCGPSRP
jgi:hypothetical protein